MKADQKQRRRSCGRRPLQISRARDFRKTATEAEEGTWHLLRGFREDGFAFRRQHPIGMYIVDFCSPGELLIVEIDGSIHAQASQVRHDAKRDEWLRAMGYTVLRISNGVVQAAPGEFLARVKTALEELSARRKGPLTPGPSPPRGQGNDS